MLEASYCKYILKFIQPAITSRATMLEKETFFIKIHDIEDPNIFGIGECAIFRGLSSDDIPNFESILKTICDDINTINISDIKYSSIRFGLETALADLKNGGKHIIYDTKWRQGNSSIPINGLVWMGSYDDMFKRINEKISNGFNCIKLKIGGIKFEDELKLLNYIRSSFPISKLQIRLDANGAFSTQDALSYLDQLSVYNIHSIEQPIKPKQWNELAIICKNSPIPIALDEELLGINDMELKNQIIQFINPSFLVLKPSLCGGFYGAEEWINVADRHKIGWWATSALESNIGLNAIAQWISTKEVSMPQGLGTGLLFSNNIKSPIEQINNVLIYNTTKQWDLESMVF